MKIALIGSYPPPYGGISVHIQRLATHLEAAGIDYVIYDISRILTKEKNIVPINNIKKWLLKYIFFARENVIHYHSPNWLLRAVLGLMSLRGKKTVISIHGESLNDSLKNGGWLRKKIIVFALKHTSFIITVNPKIKKLVESLGVPKERVAIIPSFLPPTVKKEDIDEIPQQIWDFIDSHIPVISANAFRISFYNNQDLYGIDMCIDLCAGLKDAYPQIGFVFCLPDIGDYDYFHKMKEKIADRNIENSFLFITKPYQLYPILMKSDVFVRPTNVDGYGVSIAEAIYLKVPAIASDVCTRPKGTILFKSRDINEFTLKVRNILSNYGQYKQGLDAVKLEDNFEEMLKVYKKLLEG